MDIKKLLEIENRYNLYEDKIDNINYWIYSRFEIFQFYLPTLINKEIGQTHHKPTNTMYKIKCLIKMLKNCIFMGRLQQKKADICILNSERRILINGKYECMYSQEIYKHFRNRAIMIERPYDYSHMEPIEKGHTVYTDYISIKCNIKYILHKLIKTSKYRYIYNQVETRLKNPLTDINNAFQISCNFEYIYELVTRNIIRNQTRIKEMEQLLNRIQPKLIIEVVGYSNGCMAVNEVAKRKGIPTLELQHGVIEPEHFGYNYQTSNIVRQFPDVLLTFGNFWNQNANYPIDKGHIKAVGFPYFEKQVHTFLEQNKHQRFTILFISQGTIGKQLANLACQFSKMQNANYRIIYKLHPGEFAVWRKEYPDLLKCCQQGTIEVIDSNAKSIYEYFSQSDLQIGVGSTALFEGLAFHLKTIIYKAYGYERMKYLYNNGYAALVSTPEELMSAVTEKDFSDSFPNIEYFWENNALDNLIETVNSYLLM